MGTLALGQEVRIVGGTSYLPGVGTMHRSRVSVRLDSWPTQISIADKGNLKTGSYCELMMIFTFNRYNDQ